MGAVVYQNNCAACHGADPAGRSQNIQAGVTTTALSQAYRKVSAMNRFTTSLSSTDNLNLAAYIKSRVGP